MHVVACPDKFRGTATAADVAAAIGRAVTGAGGTCIERPLADGGEGSLEVLGGPNRRTVVTGPLGDPVEAGWRLQDRTAFIEMARASGLAVVGGAEGNDPIAASTLGTGELIAAAVESGARRVVLFLGGSATTDGGFGAIRGVGSKARLRGVELLIACDVRTRFVDAAAVFAPQKGATAAQVSLLTRRLQRIVQVYRSDYGVDVSEIDGAGAAGGLAGGLLCLGGRIVSGFDILAEEVGLAELIDGADLVITGEGFVDEQSFDGKVVGGVADLAHEHHVPVLAVAGEVFDGCEARVDALSLVRLFGRQRAMEDTEACIEAAVAGFLAGR